MLRVDLVALERAGSLEVDASVPISDPLWADSDIELIEPVTVRLRVTLSGTGQVVARGRLGTRTRRECRRCLDPVDQDLAVPVELVWEVPDEMSGEEEGEIRFLDPRAVELDLGSALREELLLASPMYVECRDDCQGLCPRCGRNRNEESCDCVVDELDPRWGPLRALKTE